MADDLTTRLELPLLFAGQALKELFHNQALARLDVLVQPVALSADLTAPPPSPAPGETWIVADSAGGDWAGHGGEIASWANGWLFVRPLAGWQIYVADRQCCMRFDGHEWAAAAVRPDGFYVAGARVVGTQQAAIATPAGGANADLEARVAISDILAAMRAHGLIEAG
jgi:hypothetical protein